MLELISASKRYNNKPILNNVSAYFPPHKTICLWGESGAGKSTILNILAGMTTLTEGQALYKDVSIERINKVTRYRGNFINYMPCGDTLLERLTVRENILFNQDKLAVSVEEILSELNILSLIDKYPSELSSGEYKRVCFAKCMIANVSYYLLDEPTSNLDKESSDLIRNYINKLQGIKGIIIATHDRAIKVDSNMVYVIKNGKMEDETDLQ